MNFNFYGSIYGHQQAKAGGGYKKPKNNNYQGAGRNDDKANKYLLLHIRQLTEKEKRLANDPKTKPEELAEIREEIERLKGERKRQKLTQNDNFLKDAVLK